MSPRAVAPRLPVEPCFPALRKLAADHEAERRGETTTNQFGTFPRVHDGVVNGQAGLPWAVSHVLGCSRRHAHRIIRDGLTWEQADHLAIGFGLHPANVWGEQWWHPGQPYLISTGSEAHTNGTAPTGVRAEPCDHVHSDEEVGA